MGGLGITHRLFGPSLVVGPGCSCGFSAYLLYEDILFLTHRLSSAAIPALGSPGFLYLYLYCSNIPGTSTYRTVPVLYRMRHAVLYKAGPREGVGVGCCYCIGTYITISVLIVTEKTVTI